MSANGLCKHNNPMSYCPSCIREKKSYGSRRRHMGRMGIQPQYMGIMPQVVHPMGSADFGACPEGYYDLKILGIDTGQCVPELDTAISAAQGGVTGSLATGVAQSSATQQAAKGAIATRIGTWIVNNPLLAAGGVLGLAGVIYLVARK